MPAKRLSLATYLTGLNNGDRLVLSRAITLIESTLPADQLLARDLLNALPGVEKPTFRIGITGVPGVGKSTFIEAFGSLLTHLGKKVAVLSVDPSSQRTKGSILGDKTRMEQLSYNPLAFVRPSPAGNTPGGVTDTTSECILLCEAAGFEVIIVETVGVGQSETSVKDITDFMLLLMLPGAGDELQGIKRGIMELADAVVINKSDENNLLAKKAQIAYQNALHLYPAAVSGWTPPVLLCSAIEQTGILEIWDVIARFENQLRASGSWEQQRNLQQIQWLHRYIQRQLLQQFYENEQVKRTLPLIEAQVSKGDLLPVPAAKKLLELPKAEN